MQRTIYRLPSHSKNGKRSSKLNFPFYVTNNWNEANNLMLWWTLEHRAITFCWGGLFYNWGEDSNSTHPNYFPSISRGEMFELPLWNCMVTVKWRLRWWQLCVIEFLLQSRPVLSHKQWSFQIFLLLKIENQVSRSTFAFTIFGKIITFRWTFKSKLTKSNSLSCSAN